MSSGVSNGKSTSIHPSPVLIWKETHFLIINQINIITTTLTVIFTSFHYYSNLCLFSHLLSSFFAHYRFGLFVVFLRVCLQLLLFSKHGIVTLQISFLLPLLRVQPTSNLVIPVQLFIYSSSQLFNLMLLPDKLNQHKSYFIKIRGSF